eukprot:12181576-Alexandrium_andersonii.AAC.1
MGLNGDRAGGVPVDGILAGGRSADLAARCRLALAPPPRSPPLKSSTRPRATVGDQVSPSTSTAVNGPEVASCSTGATPPEPTS